MLTKDEWKELEPHLMFDLESIKKYREENQSDIREAMAALKSQACEKFSQITNFRETNMNAIWHHRLSVHGPECPTCGHLLRTPQASFCANCGVKSMRLTD